MGEELPCGSIVVRRIPESDVGTCLPRTRSCEPRSGWVHPGDVLGTLTERVKIGEARFGLSGLLEVDFIGGRVGFGIRLWE